MIHVHLPSCITSSNSHVRPAHPLLHPLLLPGHVHSCIVLLPLPLLVHETSSLCCPCSLTSSSFASSSPAPFLSPPMLFSGGRCRQSPPPRTRQLAPSQPQNVERELLYRWEQYSPSVVDTSVCEDVAQARMSVHGSEQH